MTVKRRFDADDMASITEELIMNPGERLQVAEAGYQAWREQFPWERIALRYEQLHQALVENPTTSPAR